MYDAVSLLQDAAVPVRIQPPELGMRDVADCSVKFQQLSKEAKESGQLKAGAMVQTPHIVCVVFSPEGSCWVFDSHAHGDHGALIATFRRAAGWTAVCRLIVQCVREVRNAHYILLHVD